MLLTCRESRVRLDDYCDGNLSASESHAVKAHIAQCDDCHRLVATHAAVVSLLREATDARPSSGYYESLPMRLSARIAAARERRSLAHRVGAIVATVSVTAALAAILVRPPSNLTSLAESTPRKPVATGLPIRVADRWNAITSEPTTRKPVPDRILASDASRDVMWVTLVDAKPNATVWDTSVATVESVSPETRTPDTWLALATLDSEPLWRYDTRLVSDPNAVPVGMTQRSESKPAATRSHSGLAAFVRTSSATFSEPTFPVETPKRKAR